MSRQEDVQHFMTDLQGKHVVVTAGGTREPIVKVGFAAETQDLLENARQKLVRKRLAFICANDVTAPDAGFGVDTNRITILYPTGESEELPWMSKDAVAHAILNRVVPLLEGTTGERGKRRV
jgi:phosphopantothenoylcysteine decarboxylase/phosphopantothenate--cysteine ligase